MPARPPRLARPLAAAVALLAFAGTARADVVTFSGQRTGTDPVSFSGSLDVTVTNTTSATLRFTLTNTTPRTSGGTTNDAFANGFITGFGFSVPSNVNVSNSGATLVSTTDPDFRLLNRTTSPTTLQAGSFDYALSTGTQLHSVAPDRVGLGLGAGQSATFVVNVTGANLAGLTALGIMNERISAGDATPFSVRFRSTNTHLYAGAKGDGDKVPVTVGSITVVPPPTNPIPAPPGAVLAVAGFGSLLLGRLRRKS